MGTPMVLPYQNAEILEAEYFAKTGHLLNEADTGLQVGGEADFGTTLNAPADLVGDIFEKARRAPVKHDVRRDGHHDSTARIVAVDDDLEAIDETWDELLGGSAVVAEKRRTLGKTVAELLGIVRYEDRIIDGHQWKFAFNQAGEVVKSRPVYE